MNVFETHSRIINDYSNYIRSFVNIADPAIRQVVEEELERGKLWPEPLLQFNPSFEQAGTVGQIANSGKVHPELAEIFKGYSLYRHQLEAISLGIADQDFVVTSGTGSGKSLTYIGSIFNSLLCQPAPKGVVAIVVYPMNALINSQDKEFNDYKRNYEEATGREFPITFGRYTGQENEEARIRMRERPPHVLLTNYMMLELILTRMRERPIRDAIYENLRFLSFDEMHTYRGRQGADVALLIRRITTKCAQHVTCTGTSATMVSSGSLASQREQVALFATKFFGRPFQVGQIINETLTRSLVPNGPSSTSESLARAINTGIDPSRSLEELKRHPMAIWLENSVALQEVEGQLIRRKPQQISEIVKSLVSASGLSEKQCRLALIDLLQWISTVNQRTQETGSRYTLLPFKLHQFFSQTGSVYTTLEQDENRFITLEPGVYQQSDAGRKPIFPNVFSRATGQAFICVSRTGTKLEPREFRESADEEENSTDGYLLVGDDVWNPAEDMDFLPESWIRLTKNGYVPESDKKEFFPERLYFDEYGNCSQKEPLKYSAWFMKAPLLFDPSGGVFFDAKTSEGTKLTKLGSEGRSTSTTITAFSILNRLKDSGYPLHDQKLLSFTDNRQDAALQAGHFNDFLQVVRLRSAIYKALSNAPDNTLSYTTIGEAIFDALELPFVDYANKNEEPALPHVRRIYETTFQTFLLYRALADLRRSWQIILPSLEHCALLQIEYADVTEVSAHDSFWKDLPLFAELAPAARAELITTILDFFRYEYAIHSENFLTQSKLKESERDIRERLRSPWALDRTEKFREPYYLRYETLSRSTRVSSKSAGATSALGKYFKLYIRQLGIDLRLRGKDYTDFISLLMRKLEEADYLKSQPARNKDNEEVPIYRLKIEKILWKLGDGKTVKADVIKRRSYKDQQPRPNAFFREVYQQDVANTKRFRGDDHTGQLGTEIRMEREILFREGKINALFCSPTMELGIDIGGLSVVHLRNAPPNPANYAQRSGRAGRSGQGALIFTYCSSYAPHDRHYFQQQAELVAGTVQAPRLDLCNKELLVTHLNAMAVSEIGLPGMEESAGGRPSLMRLVVDDNDKLPLASEVSAGLAIAPGLFAKLKADFSRVIADFEPEILARGDSWYTDQWIEQNLAKLSANLDASLERWRSLYRSARTILSRATQKIDSGVLGLGSDEYRKQKRNQDQATRQLDLLRNDSQRGSAQLSEFYPYRYLASEGFLPGYNFTRLPLRIFLPTSDSSGEFVSRPRAIALREFGPMNIIYFNGRKYRVSQLIVQDAESCLTEAKLSKKAGYFLTADQKDLEICPFTGLNLGDQANCERLHHLLEMSESRAEEVDRISCEEEERVSRGYEINTYFSVDAGNLDRVKKAVVRSSETDLLNLRFIPAARLVQVNTKWRNSQSEGFPIGLLSGDWRSSVPSPDDNLQEQFWPVKLWTSNVADALHIEPLAGLGLSADGIISLQHALKRSIEMNYQVESNEIGVVAVGDVEAPNILIYEAAEGSLGILSRFVEDIGAFNDVVTRAIAICRYDDAAYTAPASYDDLLSYYNQRDHKRVDRALIKDALLKLKSCSVEIQSNHGYDDYESHYQAMLRGLDPSSSTETKFIQHLYQNGLRLPDAAQKRVDGLYIQPDFYYEPRIWVFCDGTPHDDPAIQADDDLKRQELIARGDEVWVYYYRDNLGEKIAARPDIFKKVR